MPSNKISAIEPVQCKICNATVQRKKLNQHLQTHEKSHFVCDICKVYKAKRKDALQNHKKAVHNVGEESIHDCLFCKKKLPSFGTLEMHLRSHTKERPYFCKFCPHESSIMQNSQIHQRNFHPMKRQPALNCPICLKEFFENKYLKLHLQIHLVSVENLPFKCGVCSKAFRNSTNLNCHKRVHSKEKPFPCEICTATFSQEEHLKSHMRVHTGEKPYVCTICKRGFAHRASLKIHIRTHSGEKPYACVGCKRSFAQRPHLKSHMRTHSGEKPFSCRECKVAYADKRSLQAHLKRCHS